MQPRNRTQRDGISRGDAPERDEHSVGLCQPEGLRWERSYKKKELPYRSAEQSKLREQRGREEQEDA